MEELLKLYGVTSAEELKKMIENNDEKVKELIEFLKYYQEKEGCEDWAFILCTAAKMQNSFIKK